jgi:hypothetical protein
LLCHRLGAGPLAGAAGLVARVERLEPAFGLAEDEVVIVYTALGATIKRA